MGRINLVRNSFLGGEVGPESYGRTDLPQWNHCHEILENVISLPSGSAIRRPPFRFVKQTQANKVAACYPFAFSDTESYILEISTPASGHSVIKIIDATNFTVYDITADASVVPLYAAADLNRLQIKQAADVLWIVHENYQPMILRRQSGPLFYIEDGRIPGGAAAAFAYTKVHQYQPFRPVNTLDIKLLPAATTGSTTLDALNAAASPIYFFSPAMIGTYFKVTQTSTGNQYTGMCRIVSMSGVASGGKYAQANILVIDDFVNTSSSADWEEAAWSAYRGWPRTVSLMDSRIWFGGNASEPDRVWASEISAFFNLDARGSSAGSGFPAQTASSPFNFTPNSGDVNQIEFLSAGKTLFAGTSQREFVVDGPDTTQSISVENVSMAPETAHGARYAMAERVAYSVIAIQPTGRRLREYVFNFVSNSYEGTDLTLHASHLVRDKIQRIAWQEEPFGLLWAHDDLGQLRSLTRERQQGVLAWNRHTAGGTGAVVKSMCVVPDDDGVRRLFAIIKRTILGADYYSLECLDDPYDGSTPAPANMNFFDSWTRATDAGGLSVWPALAPHLAGQTVKVVASADISGEPNYEGEFVVANDGSVTINRAVKDIVVGLAYKSKIRTLKAEGGSQIGSAQGEMKRTDKLLIRVFDTYGLSYGTNDDNQSQIIFWKNNLPGKVALFTGDKFVDFPNGWDRDGQIQLESDWPFPFGVNFLVARMTVNEV